MHFRKQISLLKIKNDAFILSSPLFSALTHAHIYVKIIKIAIFPLIVEIKRKFKFLSLIQNSVRVV